jgi:hypothetical protein
VDYILRTTRESNQLDIRPSEGVHTLHFSGWHHCRYLFGWISVVSDLHRFTAFILLICSWASLFLIPASVAPLRKICLGEDNLLLLYGDNRARLWDTKTREFRRSMSVEKAEEMLKQGGWNNWCVSDICKLF